MMMVGGFSDPKPATPEIQQLADQVKTQLESKENKTYGMFEAIQYRSQVVAGTNYLIKVQTSGDEYVHIKVFQALPHENQGPRLTGCQTGKTRDDPLTEF
ncbi:cystatin-A [Numida meleagris]|uniref:cystatin-A n=1 Tax=Numida meleagris TaxID=8996 RepID=UPI000B3DDC8E|nr:cystatin-A [Numida meleagris]